MRVTARHLRHEIRGRLNMMALAAEVAGLPDVPDGERLEMLRVVAESADAIAALVARLDGSEEPQVAARDRRHRHAGGDGRWARTVRPGPFGPTTSARHTVTVPAETSGGGSPMYLRRTAGVFARRGPGPRHPPRSTRDGPPDAPPRNPTARRSAASAAAHEVV
jgi:hypothetical protein